MSKLPPEFVKASVTTEPKPRTRKPRKSSMVAAPAEIPRDPRELMLLLTDEEYAALEEARQALVAAGQQVTLEQMLHRVIAEWDLRRKQPAPAAPVAPVAPEVISFEGLVEQLFERVAGRIRELAKSPVPTWHKVVATLRRRTGLAAR